MFLPRDVLEWALNVVVLRSGSRTILIDSAQGVDPDLDLRRARKLAQRLETAGAGRTCACCAPFRMQRLESPRNTSSRSPSLGAPPGHIARK
jgi:hypothetical protein